MHPAVARANQHTRAEKCGDMPVSRHGRPVGFITRRNQDGWWYPVLTVDGDPIALPRKRSIDDAERSVWKAARESCG